MRTCDQLHDYEAFCKRGDEVGFLQALAEWCDKAREDAVRDVVDDALTWTGVAQYGTYNLRDVVARRIRDRFLGGK